MATKKNAPKIDFSLTGEEPDGSPVENQLVLDDRQTESAPEPLLGDILGKLAGVPNTDPSLPGFTMVDEPEELPTPAEVADAVEHGGFPQADSAGSYSAEVNEMARTGYVEAVNARAQKAAPVAIMDYSADADTGGANQGSAHMGEIIPPTAPGTVKWESRISIVDAWMYPGNVATAPDWVDRNWVGYASNHDSVRNIEPGPCLRVPDDRDPDAVVIARPGDYVVRQELVLGPGRVLPQLEVWEGEQFQRLFMRVAETEA